MAPSEYNGKGKQDYYIGQVYFVSLCGRIKATGYILLLQPANLPSESEKA